MIRIAVKIDPARIQQARKALGSVAPGVLVAGRAVRNVMLSHCRTVNAEEPNKLGGKRTNLWADIGRSVVQPRPEGDNRIKVDITHPVFKHKVTGGVITPKVKKWLAIPANALAYGKPPISFNLQFIPLGKTKAMLVRKDAMKKRVKFTSQARGEFGEVRTIKQDIKLPAGAVMFWLVKRVKQKPHDRPFPAQADMEDAARTTFDAWLKLMLGRMGKP